MTIESGLSRRQFLRYVTIGGVAVPLYSVLPFVNEAHAKAIQVLDEAKGLTDLQRAHRPKVTLPPVVEDGSQAPLVVQMDHPMDDDHYIKSIQILNFNDPVVIKGQFYFTPVNGEVYFGTQIRLAGGESTVWVIAECSQHGPFAISRSAKVAAGGC